MHAVTLRPRGARNLQDLSVRTTVAVACSAVIVARLVFVWQPLRPDEGGYLLAARNWRAGGEFLYGDFHVDRPPLLMLIFRLAALSDWDRMIRLLTLPFALVVVVAAARAGYLAGGRRAARWSAMTGAALVSSPALGADQANGELFAVAFVSVSVALTLDAWKQRTGAAQYRFALAAGAAGGAASLVKQNFLDGLFFVAVLVLAESMQARGVTERSRLTAIGSAVGAALPHLLVAVWATSVGVGGLRLWTDLAAFRGDAFAVIWRGSTHAPVLRGVTLVALAVVSALVPLIWTWVRACRARRWPLSPEEWAVNGALLFGVASIAAGGSYWPHYLLQLAPMLALACGMVAGTTSPSGASMRLWSTIAAGLAAVAILVTTSVYATMPRVWYQERMGLWLAGSSQAGDSAIVAYGTPSILETSDLTTPYPFLWSLPMRTLDPDQARLRATLAGSDAPTWVVQVHGFDSWGIDDHGRLRSLIVSHYRVAATVCGHRLWLRSELSRDLAPLPDC
jgi:hypothetical protein